MPLVGEGNAMPGVRSLNVDVAGRYDEYSDVGITRNPKIGIDWSPVEDMKLRASYGTSFRAPTIAQIYGNSTRCSCRIIPIQRSITPSARA